MLGSVLVFAAFVLDLLPGEACITTVDRLSNFSGVSFEIEDDDCDAFLYKSERMSVRISEKRRGAAKTELFNFTPAWWAPPPEISVDPERSTIRVSVAAPGTIYTRLEKWRDMRVEYDIWKPDEPHTVELRQRCGDAGCQGVAPTISSHPTPHPNPPPQGGRG